MSEATVVLKELNHSETGWYEFVDANGTKYSTKKEQIVEPARDGEGKSFLLEYTEKQNGKYTNRYLDKVTPAAAEANGAVNPGDGSYIRGKTNPEDQLWITARHAVTEARTAVAERANDYATTKDYAAEVGVLAHAFFNAVIGLRHLPHAQSEPSGGTDDGDQIPF